MKIRIGFSTTDAWFSKIIRFCTKAKVSHTYIRFYDETIGANMVVHVEKTMLMVLGEEFDKLNTPKVEYIIDGGDALQESMRENLRNLEKKFNWFDWVGWLPFLSGWMKRKVRSPKRTFNRMICVDYILRVLSDAKIAYLPEGLMTPELLRQWCDHHYELLGWEKENLNGSNM